MLVLSRKKGESIVINENITVTLIEIRDDKVRLGFEVPEEMSLHRKEIYDAMIAHQVAQNRNTEPVLSIESQQQLIQRLLQTIKDQQELIRSQEERIQQLIRDDPEGT